MGAVATECADERSGSNREHEAATADSLEGELSSCDCSFGHLAVEEEWIGPLSAKICGRPSRLS